MLLVRTFCCVRSDVTGTLVFATPEDLGAYYLRSDLDGLLLGFLEQGEALMRQGSHIVTFRFS